ncbi:MAG: VWA domain-containing protein, partial [Bdellovibrionales bacterium]|nr:VWA domain-containing protein [Bdellovibrionales bacterium]
EEFYPPKQSRSQFQKVVSRLLAPRKLSMKTNIKDALAFLASQLKRPTIIFILSDFLSDPFHDELKLLTYRHDVIGVKFEDVLDTNLPSAGIVEIADAENGQRILVDTGSRRCKEQLKLLELHRTNALRESFRSANADFVTISDHLLEPIIELMRSRTKRY